jgi:hypothetical protein
MTFTQHLIEILKLYKEDDLSPLEGVELDSFARLIKNMTEELEEGLDENGSYKSPTNEGDELDELSEMKKLLVKF